MEESIISLVFSTLSNLVDSYPDAGWAVVVTTVLLTVCGLASVATMWMPVPTETTGWYHMLYSWLHALAAHYNQNVGAKADGSASEVKAAVRKVMDK